MACLILGSSRNRAWLLGLLLVAATLLAYQPAWQAGFIWDDDEYVTDNPLLTAPDGLKRIWFSLDSPSQYFPLTYTVFRIEHSSGDSIRRATIGSIFCCMRPTRCWCGGC